MLRPKPESIHRPMAAPPHNVHEQPTYQAAPHPSMAGYPQPAMHQQLSLYQVTTFVVTYLTTEKLFKICQKSLVYTFRYMKEWNLKQKKKIYRKLGSKGQICLIIQL